MPRFSIVITTRNRPDLVVNTLQSVLEQDFKDFEVIVSDNSDNDTKAEVQNALGAMLHDPRVRYVAPSRVLPMTIHWEWAVAQASGEFVGVLTDRMLIRLHTLSTVNDILEKRQLDLICYERANVIEGAFGYAVPSIASEIQIDVKATASFIEAFSRSNYRRLDNPRFLNGFASATLLNSIRHQYGSVFTGIAPDYGFLMRMLDQKEQFHFIENALLLKHSEDRSNGKSFTHMKMTSASQDFLEKMQGEQAELVKFAPIPDDVLMITNLLAREYEIARAGQKNGKFQPIDPQSFYNESMKHLLSLDDSGPHVPTHHALLERYRRDHDLRPYRQTFRDWRRNSKRKIRRLLGMKDPVRKRAVPTEGYPLMIDALRADAANYRANHSN